MEHLTPEEFALLRAAVTKHRPDLLPLVDEAVNVRTLTNEEGNALRDAVGWEIKTEANDYDNLIDRLARMMDMDRAG